MTDSSEVYELLQIATLSEQWPDLHPIRNRALDKLRQIARQPAHAPEDKKVVEPKVTVSSSTQRKA